MTQNNRFESVKASSRPFAGIRLPVAFEAAAAVRIAARLGVQAVEVDAGMLERHLGAPGMPAAMAMPAADGFATGMLPLEEEILEDEIELARRTLEERRRTWRRSADLSPLAVLRRGLPPAVEQVFVRWPHGGADEWTLEFACRLTAAFGATALTTAFAAGLPPRLVAVADRHGISVALEPRPATFEDDFSAIMSAPAGVRLTLDAASLAAPADTLRRLPGDGAARAIQVSLASGSFAAGPGTARRDVEDDDACALLRTLRDLALPIAATVTVADWRSADEPRFVAAAAEVLDRVRACLVRR